MVRVAKHWTWTLNNFTETEEDQIRKWCEQHSADFTYVIWGKERGENDTPHLQGYAAFTKRISMHALKRILGRRVHAEMSKGTPDQNARYCKKDGDYVEFGTLPARRGKRTDLDAIYERVKAGATRDEIRDEFFKTYAKYYRAIDTLITDLQQPRTWETEVVVYWGKTGTGKTRQVFQFHALSDIYSHPGDQWFDGYHGQPIALFDDYNGSEFKLTYLLKLLDRYPMRVPIKGNFVNWIPKKIYFTSNRNPTEWYTNALEEHRNALFRRLKTITEFK
jgi:hypothetical protein